MDLEPETEPVKLPKNGSFYLILYISNLETDIDRIIKSLHNI